MFEQKFLYIYKLFKQYTILLPTLFIYEIILPTYLIKMLFVYGIKRKSLEV